MNICYNLETKSFQQDKKGKPLKGTATNMLFPLEKIKNKNWDSTKIRRYNFTLNQNQVWLARF